MVRIGNTAIDCRGIEETFMSGLVRRVVELSVEQNEFLQRRSREIGISEDDLVRRAIDAMTSEPEAQASRLDGWRRLKAVMEQRARLDVPQTGRTWTRQDLYDSAGRH
jgi:hypothetical protein